MAKDLASKDVHHGDRDTRAAFRRRYDDSRTSLFDLPLADAFPNPRNPRYPDDPEVIETAGSLLEVGQLQPIVVVTRDSFVEAYPDLNATPEGVPDGVKYVIVIGNRRHAGAARNKWKSLEAILAPSVATAAEIEDRILHENIHRQQLPPLLEADLLKRKMDREGLSLREVAKKISKTHAYVDSRLGLLKLIPEFKGLLQREFPLASSERTLKLKSASTLAKLPRERQKERWHAGPPFQEPAVIPDYTPAAAQPTSAPAAESAPAVIPDYSKPAPNTTTTAVTLPPTPVDSAPAPASTPAPTEPAPTSTSSTVSSTSDPGAAGSSADWPMTVEAADVPGLASILVRRLSPAELSELSGLLQPAD
jgi:ParB family chromosome partitioning protein